MKKKTASEQEQHDLPEEGHSLPEMVAAMQTTVSCPVHHNLLFIQTENREVDGKTVLVRFAICDCNVPDNQHLGNRVWEQT